MRTPLIASEACVAIKSLLELFGLENDWMVVVIPLVLPFSFLCILLLVWSPPPFSPLAFSLSHPLKDASICQ